MEFNEKLQELRKQKGITQEELAQCLYVSRTAVSKWESGRGYPNIESLKLIAKFFSVTIDQLLSTNEILDLAQEDGMKKVKHFRTLVFGLTDICMALLLLLPLFAQRQGADVYSTIIFSLNSVQTYLKVLYFVIIISTVVFGTFTLAISNGKFLWWDKIKEKLSLLIGTVTLLLFAISLQPYVVVFAFVLLGIKVLTLIKW